MSKSQVTIAFDGEKLRTGKMDVRELAPALLAFGDLVQQTNRVLNGDQAEISVNVKAEMKAGSFPVDLEVVQKLSNAGQSLLHGVKNAKDIIEVIAAGHKGLLWLRKKIGGKKIKSSTALTYGNVKLEIEGEIQPIEVSVDVVRVYNDKSARESLNLVLKPLERPGIDVFQIKKGKRLMEQITESEAVGGYQDAPSVPETIAEGTRVAALEIVKPSFKERYSWMFSDGTNTFQAELADEEFFAKVTGRERIQFGSGDVLKVELFTKSWRDESGLHTSNVVLKVLEIIKAPQQIPLLPE